MAIRMPIPSCETARFSRTEGNIILGNGGDDLIFRMLENRPDTMPGAAVSVSVRTAFIEYVVSQQRDMSGIGCGKSCNDA